MATQAAHDASGLWTDIRPLFQPVTTVEVAGTKSFCAMDKYVAGADIDGVKIVRVGENFKNYFFGKTELCVPDGTLRIQKLKRPELDVPIRIELGNAVEIYLAHHWELLKMQGRDIWQPDKLLANNYVNVAHVRDKHGIPRAVFADCATISGGWFIDASPFSCRERWSAGSQFISPVPS